MKIAYSWLKNHLPVTLSVNEVADLLTFSGLEVENIEKVEAVKGGLEGLVVGEVITCEKHPDADRLQLCKVDVGQAEPLQIVCGAPNARVGLKAPCAMLGAKLADFEIKKAKVRGIESFGMMCSAKELGLAEQADGLLEFPASATVGQDVREYLGLDDTLYTIKLTPNRADCLSILGVARDVVAITGAAMTLPTIAEAKLGSNKTVMVNVAESAACPSYFGRVVEGVNASAETPDWMIRALERSGLRSISVVVDITNYVLLLVGTPLHTFDLKQLNHQEIVIRQADEGEKVVTLDGKERTLIRSDLVIANGQKAVALAGVMGLENTMVSEHTTSIFLEAALFDPSSINTERESIISMPRLERSFLNTTKRTVKDV